MPPALTLSLPLLLLAALAGQQAGHGTLLPTLAILLACILFGLKLRRDQRQLQEALVVSEARFLATFDQASIGVAHIGLDGRWLRVNEQFCAILGTSRERLLATRFQDVARPEDLASDLPQLRRLLAGEIGVYRTQKCYCRADGGTLWVAVATSLMHDAQGRPQQFITSIEDITERKQAEEQTLLLRREVDHRARNALAVVRAAVRLTRADSPAEFLRAVEGRIACLARAHAALARRQWHGAELHGLIEGELAPFRDGAEDRRTELVGPLVMLGAEATQGFCLVLHELAANAAKYGALAQPRLHPLGRVAIHWQVRDGWLWLRWQESGGPATLPPERRGFGLRIIEQTVQGQLHGRLERRWTAEGLVCEIEIPHGPMALRAAPPLAAE